MCEWGRWGASHHPTIGREIAKQESMHGLNELISTLSARRPMAGEVMVSRAPEASVKVVWPPEYGMGAGTRSASVLQGEERG